MSRETANNPTDTNNNQDDNYNNTNQFDIDNDEMASIFNLFQCCLLMS
jgi:hypothetical protein